MKRIVSVILCCWTACSPCQAETIKWFSAPGATNKTSANAALAASCNFELGVFTGNFVPTAANAAQWAANWVPAQRIAYHTSNKRFDGQFAVTHNTPPFTVGKPAYVWGFQTGTATSEWILFRNASWTWPAPNPMDPIGLDWDTSSATPILGEIIAGSSPHLMKSNSVTTWQQWHDSELAGDPLNGPDDDADHDGQSNMMEFVFGTPPNQAGEPTATPIDIITHNSQQFLQINLPRRLDHLAILTVEVSSDLTHWNSATTLISSSPTALVARDITPLGSATQRFLRLKAELPTP